MATYKVLQDIEAEDKLIGPLSLRQFIYAVISLVAFYLTYLFFTLQPAVAVLPLPFALFFGLLAAPFFGGQQSSEVWLLAIIRFWVKPRKRVWDQAGIKDLVTITAPKKEDKHLVKEYSQDEVKSRLSALANTLDTRGWVVKNVSTNLYNQRQQPSDRLVDPSSLPQAVPDDPIDTDEQDIFDSVNNQTAQKFDQMIQTASTTKKAQLREQMLSPQNHEALKVREDYWFLNQPDQSQVPTGQAVFSSTPAVQPVVQAPVQTKQLSPTEEEAKLLQNVKARHEKADSVNSHLKTILPLSQQPENPVTEPSVTSETATTPTPEVKQKPNPAIYELANNDDLDIATIARQAEKSSHKEDDGEVVISLH